MENVTDRVSNPFGMRPPCPEGCPGGHDAVFGYGDANAAFHVVGDHPGVHGGADTGIPFTGGAGGRLLSVLSDVGLLEREEGRLDADGVFLSYLYPCCSSTPPSERDYADLERFFDAELRAITADVLLPVGERALRHVVREYTAKGRRLDGQDPHAAEIPGRGFLVVAVREPADWSDGDAEQLRSTLERLIERDYRQEAELSRFLAGREFYFVR